MYLKVHFSIFVQCINKYKSFSYGNKRDKGKADNSNSTTLLRIENRQTKSNLLSVPRG